MFCRSFCFLSFWPLHCLSFLNLRGFITPLVSPSFSPPHCMSFFDLRLLISLPLWYLQAFGHCIVCPSSIYGVWLAYTFGISKCLAIALPVLLRFTAFDYPFDISKPFTIALSVLLRFTGFDYSFGISKLFAIVCSVLLFTTSDFPFGISKRFGHCIVCSSSIYGFWFGIFRPFLHVYN
jgi:hypothetical protein